MMSQLRLITSHVEDLLDLRQIKQGVFSLASQVFDPTKTFDMICKIFEPQAASKGIKISVEILSRLPRPENLSYG